MATPTGLVRVRVPGSLRALTGGRAEVQVAGATVREALAALDALHPGLAARVLDERGEVRRYVNLFHNDEDVRYLAGLDTALAAGDTLTVIPAVAGGR
jgi:molybdopterin synthase sulfur carrier subunit